MSDGDRTCWAIREWACRYEVSEKGHAWKPGDNKRAGPLDYYRSKVFGDVDGHGFRELRRVAGKGRYMMVFGIFHKLLELAACRPKDMRGFLIMDSGEPATLESLSLDLIIPLRQLEFALNCLQHKDLRWIECGTLPATPGNPGNAGKSRLPSEDKTMLRQGTEGTQDEDKTKEPGASETNSPKPSVKKPVATRRAEDVLFDEIRSGFDLDRNAQKSILELLVGIDFDEPRAAEQVQILMANARKRGRNPAAYLIGSDKAGGLREIATLYPKGGTA
jgi:hypothetical protein